MIIESKYYFGTFCHLRPKWVVEELNNATGKNVTIAVVDSGCDSSLVIDSRIKEGISFVKEDSDFVYEINSNYFDKIGHGTTCIDRIFQFAPDVQILPIKVFNKTLETNPNILAEAIRCAIEKKVDIINLSLSTKLDEALNPLYRLCEKAKDLGIVIVASNSNIDLTSYPAIFDNVISVSSKIFSNPFEFYYYDDEYSECIADGFAADGLTLNLNRIKSEGNSFAAPVISAVISLIIEKFNKKDIQTIRKLLKTFSLNGKLKEL
jgi:subtilisin family serine protease